MDTKCVCMCGYCEYIPGSWVCFWDYFTVWLLNYAWCARHGCRKSNGLLFLFRSIKLCVTTIETEWFSLFYFHNLCSFTCRMKDVNFGLDSLKLLNESNFLLWRTHCQLDYYFSSRFFVFLLHFVIVT